LSVAEKSGDFRADHTLLFYYLYVHFFIRPFLFVSGTHDMLRSSCQKNEPKKTFPGIGVFAKSKTRNAKLNPLQGFKDFLRFAFLTLLPGTQPLADYGLGGK